MVLRVSYFNACASIVFISKKPTLYGSGWVFLTGAWSCLGGSKRAVPCRKQTAYYAAYWYLTYTLKLVL